MSFENETQDFMRKFFDDTINSFKEDSAPLIKQFIESHRAILSAYRDCLDELLQQDPSSQAEVKLTTMFLEMSLKMMQLQRESRKRFLTIQSKIPSKVGEGTNPSPTLKPASHFRFVARLRKWNGLCVRWQIILLPTLCSSSFPARILTEQFYITQDICLYLGQCFLVVSARDGSFSENVTVLL